jgi:hypothetical protein
MFRGLVHARHAAGKTGGVQIGYSRPAQASTLNSGKLEISGAARNHRARSFSSQDRRIGSDAALKPFNSCSPLEYRGEWHHSAVENND